MVKRYYINGKFIGDGSLAVIAGPCSLESPELGLRVAKSMKRLCDERGLLYIFKASFDKANRTSVHAWRGPGLEKGLEQLAEIKSMAGVPVLTDIHESFQAAPAGEVVDIIQIPAFLCRQTDLLVAAAKTGRIINIKKAQFLAPEDMTYVAAKCREAGNDNIMFCERGTMMGYHRLVVDMTGLITMREMGYPVVFDATHSVQRPGGLGGASGGDYRLAFPLARAAAGVGIDAIFAETHPNPKEALSDGPNMIPLDQMGRFLDEVLAIHNVRKGFSDELK
ncbi:MAG: 3-deoxy-8-phosphooctulonate synthase [Synergistaceae bacterium]|nr:3-deoxy-8-phosphooctulonate synthase [Synergistaceae bacterium]MBQ3398848.1 3-deoxy-8-phosphooctulonate synthase [Synergistaceae bacterium]MBQ3758155.1 3-deoxy-8-phosphooctulonate synthase [Synergistaceae bacterium]MBQ6114176.1 3-deoxy-8-phosphooctulonate synthase [Synergistaceae bacterium]MBQ6417051.1 3-deoxy-8-phosphooctulonate synthase [Synergistaceae bacterium]